MRNVLKSEKNLQKLFRENSADFMKKLQEYKTPGNYTQDGCTVSQCGNYRNLLSHFFGKNFLKLTFLLKKSPKSWFNKIFTQWE